MKQSIVLVCTHQPNEEPQGTIKGLQASVHLYSNHQLNPIHTSSEIIPFATAEDLELMILCSRKDITIASDAVFSNHSTGLTNMLLSLLYKRYLSKGDCKKVTLKVPASEELLATLQSCLIEMAHLNHLEYRFMDWLESDVKMFAI